MRLILFSVFLVATLGLAQERTPQQDTGSYHLYCNYESYRNAPGCAGSDPNYCRYESNHNAAACLNPNLIRYEICSGDSLIQIDVDGFIVHYERFSNLCETTEH